MQQRFKLSTRVNAECSVVGHDGGLGNLLLVRLEVDGAGNYQLRLIGLMDRPAAVHVWRLTDPSYFEVASSRSGGGAGGNNSINEELVTPPLAPLYFSPREDTSIILPYRRQMRGARDAFLVHLSDGVAGLPLQVLICVNRNGGELAAGQAEKRRASMGGRAPVG